MQGIPTVARPALHISRMSAQAGTAIRLLRIFYARGITGGMQCFTLDVLSVCLRHSRTDGGFPCAGIWIVRKLAVVSGQ